MSVKLYHGDCLDIMRQIPDKSIDMVLTDPPYGRMPAKWDKAVPAAQLWPELNRISKPGACVALFGMEPFSSALRMSNLKAYKYDWVWDKRKGGGFLNAKKRPLIQHELISIFNATRYYPQKETRGMVRNKGGYNKPGKDSAYAAFGNVAASNNEYYPKSILMFSNAVQTGKIHPTQKPVALLEYLIKTYTLDGETVFDFTMGSGSTGVACVNTGRRFIGIEKDAEYFKIAEKRIAEDF